MRLKYPKIILFILTVILAYYLFNFRGVLSFDSFLSNQNFFVYFIIGAMFPFSFTTAFATASLLIIGGNSNIPLVALIGGLGAVISDLLIFKFVRLSFKDEISLLSHEKFILFIDKKIPAHFHKAFLITLGGLLIASPIPNEFGVGILASSKLIESHDFFIFSYLMNTLGIFLIVYLGSLI